MLIPRKRGLDKSTSNAFKKDEKIDYPFELADGRSRHLLS